MGRFLTNGCSKKASNSLLLLNVLLLLVLSGCLSHADTAAISGTGEKKVVKLNKQDNGKTITVRSGTVIELELSAAAGTGYAWVVTKLDKTLLDPISENLVTNAAGEKRVGAPVLYKWSFRALKAGVTDLELSLYRRWEGPARSAKTFGLGVRIKDE
jgi:predicted secreted protein